MIQFALRDFQSEFLVCHLHYLLLWACSSVRLALHRRRGYCRVSLLLRSQLTRAAIHITSANITAPPTHTSNTMSVSVICASVLCAAWAKYAAVEAARAVAWDSSSPTRRQSRRGTSPFGLARASGGCPLR